MRRRVSLAVAGVLLGFGLIGPLGASTPAAGTVSFAPHITRCEYGSAHGFVYTEAHWNQSALGHLHVTQVQFHWGSIVLPAPIEGENARAFTPFGATLASATVRLSDGQVRTTPDVPCFQVH
jgi:hypothetical protein